MTEHKPIPVAGYTAQSDYKVAIVNDHKRIEEQLLRRIEAMMPDRGDPSPKYDGRWLSIARTHFEEGFMALNRAVFQPQRVSLPEDAGETKTSGE